MSKTCHKRFMFALAFVAVSSLVACGGGGGGATGTTSGGGGGGGSALPPKILTWSPPTTYTDSTPLNPASELDSFEIYVNDSGVFSNSDSPIAYVRAVDPGSGQVVSEFDLSNVGQFLSRDVVYQVSVRAVALSGAKSGFSQPAAFSL